MHLDLMSSMKYWIGLSLYFILTLIASAFICSRISAHKSEDTICSNRDTIVVHKFDTIQIKDTVYKNKRVVDTVYIKTDNTNVIPMQVIQKLFSKPTMYDIWVSGIEPLSLDSVNIYTKTEYKTITNYIDKVVYKDELKVYVGGGLNAFSGTIKPYVGVSVHTKSKWLIEANFGYGGDFEVGAKYKLFK